MSFEFEMFSENLIMSTVNIPAEIWNKNDSADKKIVHPTLVTLLNPPYFTFFTENLFHLKILQLSIKNMVPITSRSELGEHCSSQIPRVKPYRLNIAVHE